MENIVVTIARGFGSGGKEIAVKLSEKMGVACYDRQILDLASQYSGISKELFVMRDERLSRGSVLKWLQGKPETKDVVEPASKHFVSDVNLFNIQAKIIRDLAESESCVVIGKCADYVLRDYENVVSIYIEAPREACVESICGKMGVTREKASSMITKTDKYRADYYRYYSGGGNWTNPTNYDMTLNSARIGRERCVKVIMDYIDLKFHETET